MFINDSLNGCMIHYGYGRVKNILFRSHYQFGWYRNTLAWGFKFDSDIVFVCSNEVIELGTWRGTPTRRKRWTIIKCCNVDVVFRGTKYCPKLGQNRQLCPRRPQNWYTRAGFLDWWGKCEVWDFWTWFWKWFWNFWILFWYLKGGLVLFLNHGFWFWYLF